MTGRIAREQGAGAAPRPQDPVSRRQHAQELDLRALRAVARAAAQGREEGRREAMEDLAALRERRSRRARGVLVFSVVTALLFGLSVGLVLGTMPFRAVRTADCGGAPR